MISDGWQKLFLRMKHMCDLCVAVQPYTVRSKTMACVNAMFDDKKMRIKCKDIQIE